VIGREEKGKMIRIDKMNGSVYDLIYIVIGVIKCFLVVWRFWRSRVKMIRILMFIIYIRKMYGSENGTIIGIGNFRGNGRNNLYNTLGYWRSVWLEVE